MLKVEQQTQTSNSSAFYKFVIIGLPGVGKSTTMQKCVEHLNLNNKENPYELKIVDDLIEQRLRDPNDEVIQVFQKEKNIIIP